MSEATAYWIEVKALLPEIPEDWSRYAEIFSTYGIEGTVQTDDPPTIGGYVYEDDSQVVRIVALCEALTAAGASAVETERVKEEEWSESWKQFFVPRRVGRHFIIRPTWEECEALPDDLVIVLDPGQAFGTGDHPTTRLCLELLEKLPVAGKHVADIGCGSGILSIAAAMLGAASVVGVDVELPSIIASKENADRNGVEAEFLVGEGFRSLPEGAHYDLVLSNIISATLIHISHDASERVKPGGHWMISGIIDSNWPDVLASAERFGFALVERKQEDEWNAAILLRQ